MTSVQLPERINKMNLHLNDDNFFVEEQEVNQRKLNLMDLKLTFKEFSEELKDKFVVVDMFCGVDTYTDSDLSNYQDMGQKVIPKYREICKEYPHSSQGYSWCNTSWLIIDRKYYGRKRF